MYSQLLLLLLPLIQSSLANQHRYEKETPQAKFSLMNHFCTQNGPHALSSNSTQHPTASSRSNPNFFSFLHFSALPSLHLISLVPTSPCFCSVLSGPSLTIHPPNIFYHTLFPKSPNLKSGPTFPVPCINLARAEGVHIITPSFWLNFNLHKAV